MKMDRIFRVAYPVALVLVLAAVMLTLLVAATAAQENPVAAVDAFNRSLERIDSWLARMGLGRAYYASGFYAEALGEFEQCRDRLGEATALFLDDIPTFHHAAPLYYWLGQTKLSLGMTKQARADLEQYVSLRVDSDRSVTTESARSEVRKLNGGLEKS